MIEIKFRAYDPIRKLWIYSRDFTLFYEYWRDTCGLKQQQFTGLLDKQSKEIYEGDVVRIWGYGFKDGNEDGDFGLYQDRGKGEVTLDRFRFWLKNESFGYEGEDMITPEDCEVIGNIYENAELLKD